MSMDSRAPRREPALRRLRLFAIALWSAFLGAALTLLAALALLPAETTLALGWPELSIGFLCAWALALVPASLALMLGLPLNVGRQSIADTPAGKDSRPTGSRYGR